MKRFDWIAYVIAEAIVLGAMAIAFVLVLR